MNDDIIEVKPRVGRATEPAEPTVKRAPPSADAAVVSAGIAGLMDYKWTIGLGAIIIVLIIIIIYLLYRDSEQQSATIIMRKRMVSNPPLQTAPEEAVEQPAPEAAPPAEPAPPAKSVKKVAKNEALKNIVQKGRGQPEQPDAAAEPAPEDTSTQ